MDMNKKLTSVEMLESAVWMVGNMDTPEDKAAWWKEFREFYDEYFNHENAERAQMNFDILCRQRFEMNNERKRKSNV